MMRSDSMRHGSERPTPESGGRRRFLRLLGATPLLLPALGWLGCGDREQAENPYAGDMERDRPDVPEPAPGTPPAPAADGGDDASEEQEQQQEQVQAGQDAPSAADADALVTEVAAVQPTVEALQYVNQSEKPDQRCNNCQLYTARSDTRGKCQLFTQGLVASQGWCASWVPKVDASS